MGCPGCELWPPTSKVVSELVAVLETIVPAISPIQIKNTVADVVGDGGLSEIYSCRDEIASELAKEFHLESNDSKHSVLVDVIRSLAKCYAGQLGTMRGGHKGYADQFEVPKLYPGRMAEAARWGAPTAKEIQTKHWLTGLRRLIFVSDMGDAMAKDVPFDFLQQEIIANVSSQFGLRHIWLWLTKRPGRMAQFGQWLERQGIAWPHNLMAMASVTGPQRVSRIDELRKVPSKLKGLSVEPLFKPVRLNLEGIDWVIVGGGSDVLAEPFHVEWALDLHEQCKAAGVAFFLKQLGKNPHFENRPLTLNDKHGGDWSEWAPDWRVREMPSVFRSEA